ncbi:MAG: SseB family protein [Tranquillimonas sp.]
MTRADGAVAATPLDRAHAAMEAAPEDARARLTFYDRLAEAELHLLLAAEAQGDALSPAVWPLETGPAVLAFDREDRLADFVEAPSPYAALSGRALAQMLAGQGLTLALNLGAPSAILLPGPAVDWLAGALRAEPPQMTRDRPQELTPPGEVPEMLLAALDAKLAAAQGLADSAYLAGALWPDGTRGHLLVFVDARPGAEPALARAVGEALTFSGLDAASLDVTFVAISDSVAARLARVAVRIDLPRPVASAPAPAAPGSDPDRPPRLR